MTKYGMRSNTTEANKLGNWKRDAVEGNGEGTKYAGLRDLLIKSWI